MNTATNVAFASLLTFACLLGSGQANADSAQVLTKTVTYDARTLNSEKGARTLYARLRFAAQEVCAPLDAQELSRHRLWQACVDNSLESAVLKVNSPLLSAVHNKTPLKAAAG
jgi:UrcA family protein